MSGRQDRPLLLVTGAAGGVAQHVLPALAGRWRLRLVDRRTDPGRNHQTARPEVIIGDLTDPEVAERATRGVRAVLHLAGNGDPAARWQDLVKPNLVSWSTVLDAAAANAVPNLVFASSVHAGGGDFGPDAPVDPGQAASPCCAYGASKVYGEAMGDAAHRASGATVIALRLGAVIERPRTTYGHHYWVHPDDLAALTQSALTSDSGFGVHHAVSAVGAGHWSIDSARTALGYRPRVNPALDSHRADLPDGAVIPPPQHLTHASSA